MARYTATLKDLMSDPHTMDAINKAMSTYHLYEKKSKEEYIPSYIPTREELNSKILNRYKYREIAFESVGRFIDELEIALLEIMPYYNQLFYTIDLDYDILHNVDYIKNIEIDKSGKNQNVTTGTETLNSESTSHGTNTSTANDESTTNGSVENHNKHVNSKTPQNELSITNKGIDSVNYADEVSWNHDSNTETGKSTGKSNASSESDLSGTNKANNSNEVNYNGTSEGKESHIETTKGNYGQVSYQSLISHYRELIINVERQIIQDHRISELFMRIY